jgi:hypothetical protein
MNEKNEPTAKGLSFGVCDISSTSPTLAALTADSEIEFR